MFVLFYFIFKRVINFNFIYCANIFKKIELNYTFYFIN